MQPQTRAEFDPILTRFEGAEWAGKTHGERLDWLWRELQDLITQTDDQDDAAEIYAYLWQIVDGYDFVETVSLEEVILTL